MSAAPAIGPLTPRDLEALIAELPALERAQLRWTVPEVEGAVRALLEAEEPTQEVILAAAKRYWRALTRVQDITLAVVQRDPQAIGDAVRKRFEYLGPVLERFFGPGEHLERLVRALLTGLVCAGLGWREVTAERPSASLMAALEELKQLGEAVVSSQAGGLLRAYLLLGAVLDAAERGVMRERAVRLVELADQESWPFAHALAETDIPGLGRIRIPGYFAPEAQQPPELVFKTTMARELWALRKKLDAEGRSLLDDEEVAAEVARRRGGRAPV